MNKNRIRLTESQLHRVIKESVNKILTEIFDTDKGQYMAGLVQQRAKNRADANEYHYGKPNNDPSVQRNRETSYMAAEKAQDARLRNPNLSNHAYTQGVENARAYSPNYNMSTGEEVSNNNSQYRQNAEASHARYVPNYKNKNVSDRTRMAFRGVGQ